MELQGGQRHTGRARGTQGKAREGVPRAHRGPPTFTQGSPRTAPGCPRPPRSSIKPPYFTACLRSPIDCPEVYMAVCKQLREAPPVERKGKEKK